MFHVLGVIAKVGPGFAVTVLAEHSVDRCYVFRGIQIGDIGAEMEEILRTVCRVPIELYGEYSIVSHDKQLSPYK